MSLPNFRLHSSNFCREKRSSSPPGRFQTMICSKVSNQRNSKHAVHFKSANQHFMTIAWKCQNPCAGQGWVFEAQWFAKRRISQILQQFQFEVALYSSRWRAFACLVSYLLLSVTVNLPEKGFYDLEWQKKKTVRVTQSTFS